MSRCCLAFAVLLLTAFAAGRASERCASLGYAEAGVVSEPGIELFTRAAGAGESVVIVPGDFLLFDHLCNLAQRHRVIFYDMRNRGRSSQVTEGGRLTLEGDVRDLEAIRSHYGADRAALIGYSYLGKMVVQFALSHPGKVERIVQLGAVPMDPERTFPPALSEPPLAPDVAVTAEIEALRALRAEGLSESDPAAYCEREWPVVRRGLVGRPENAAALTSSCDLPNEWPSRLAFHMEHHFLGSMLHAVITATDLADFEPPVLVVHGARDRNAPYDGGREWAAALPGARLLTVPGAGHALHVEIDLLPILETFLSGAWPEGVEVVSSATDAQR